MTALGDDSILRIPVSQSLTLEFRRSFPYGPGDPRISGLIVRATGVFVNVEQQVILLGGDGPATFLRGLYDDFRGWEGAREWRSLEDEMSLSARHDGRVHLTWQITHQPYRPESSWSFTLTSHHGAGEDMRHLADGFQVLLTSAS